MTIDVDLNEQDRAAIDAAVERQREAEPDLTAEVLIARLARKLAAGWARQADDDRVRALTSRLASAAKTATPEQAQRALEVLGAE